MENHRIILTSIGLSCPGVSDLISKKTNKNTKVIIIPNASEELENDKYVQLAIQQFSELGINRIAIYDVTSKKLNLTEENILVYVSGGNTFKLLEDLKSKDSILDLRKYIKSGGLYIGVSAGAIICGPNIKHAILCGDINHNQTTDLDSMGITNLYPLPHSEFILDEVITSYEKSNNIEILKIQNKDYFCI